MKKCLPQKNSLNSLLKNENRFMNRIIAIPIICFLLIFKYVDSNAKTIYIKSVNDYKKSLSFLKSGDSVIWESGIYPDVRWNIKKKWIDCPG